MKEKLATKLSEILPQMALVEKFLNNEQIEGEPRDMLEMMMADYHKGAITDLEFKVMFKNTIKVHEKYFKNMGISLNNFFRENIIIPSKKNIESYIAELEKIKESPDIIEFLEIVKQLYYETYDKGEELFRGILHDAGEEGRDILIDDYSKRRATFITLYHLMNT